MAAARSKSAALPQDFETALAELETLVTTMEDGTLPLAQSLAAYQRGVALTRLCQERLTQAEQQVQVLEGDLLRPLDVATDVSANVVSAAPLPDGASDA